MRRALFALSLAASGASASATASATARSFVHSEQSAVLTPGQSELTPWTTFRVGQSRYYSGLDGRLELSHGFVNGLELALYWSFQSETKDVVADSLTQELERQSRSEFASASAVLKYQLTDATADLLGSGLYLGATLGPRASQLEARLIVDRRLGRWLLAANVSPRLVLEPTRDSEGSELEAAFVLQPSAAVAYALPHGVSLGIELRAPLGLAGQTKGRALFGGPVLGWADQRVWAALGVQPQLSAFSDASPGSRLDLTHYQRFEVRLLAGFLL